LLNWRRQAAAGSVLKSPTGFLRAKHVADGGARKRNGWSGQGRHNPSLGKADAAATLVAIVALPVAPEQT